LIILESLSLGVSDKSFIRTEKSSLGICLK